MGYFDGISASLIRSDAEGRRFYAPLGKFGKLYKVRDAADADRIHRFWRRYYIALFGVMLIAVLLTSADWRLMAAAPVAGLLTIPVALWSARGLLAADIRYADLPPLTRSQALANYSRATGRRTLGVVVALGVFMTLMGIVAGVLSGQRSFWLSAGFFGLCTWSSYRAFRRAR